MFRKRKKKPKEKQEKKIRDSFVRPLEKKVVEALTPIASRLFTPNALSFISLAAAFLTGVCFYLTSFSKYWFLLAAFFSFVCWGGDALDGAVARYRKVSNQQGYYIDHMMDSFAILFIFLGLGLSPAMKFPIAMAIVIIYFIMAMNVFLITYIENTFRISFGNVGPNEGRVLIILFSIISVFFEYPLVLFETSFLGFGTVTLWDAAGVIAALILFVIMVITIISNLFYLKKYAKEYKPMTFPEVISAIEFKLQRSKLHKVVAETDIQEELEKLANYIKTGKYENGSASHKNKNKKIKNAAAGN